MSTRVAVVTGASSGIGRAVALSLVADGIEVVGMGRRFSLLEELAQEAEAAGAAAIRPLEVDLLDEDGVISAFEQVASFYGGIDIFVANAGTSVGGTIAEGNAEAWHKVIDTNVLVTAVTTREALKLIRNGEGSRHIIFVSSYTARRPRRHGSKIYAASKAAVLSIADGLRLELHDEDSAIHVTTILPGLVETPMTEKSIAGERERGNVFEPLRPEDIAETVRYVVNLPDRVAIDDIVLRPAGQLN